MPPNDPAGIDTGYDNAKGGTSKGAVLKIAANHRPLPVQIPAGATGLSVAVNCKQQRLARICTPAGWLAAALTFQTSYDGSAYSNLLDQYGNEYTTPVIPAGAREMLVSIPDFLSIQFMKVRSGTSGNPVNQTGGPTLQFILV